LDAYAQGATPEPDGDSKLCLSCHDGTMALGTVLSRPQEIVMRGTAAGRMPSTSRGYTGRDLSGTHPVSFVVTDELVARNNAKDSPLASVAQMRADPDIHLDKNNKIQCTTCHDAHDDSNFASSGIHFYRKPRFSDVCEVCHKI
jgi:hypothetical protein